MDTTSMCDGRLEVLKNAKKNDCQWYLPPCANTARNGHLEIQERAPKKHCKWNEVICDAVVALLVPLTLATVMMRDWF